MVFTITNPMKLQQNYLIFWSMIKTVKYLHFSQMRLQIREQHPKDISRAILSLKDENGNISKTSKYAEVTDQNIEWDDTIEILYTNQEVFQMETLCEHQYGYEIEELEAIYNAQIYIKTENFFRPLTSHVFNKEGEKCGIMRYMIKVIEREAVKTSAKAVESAFKEEPTVKVDLIGKINIHAASVTVSSPIFKKDKYASDFTLAIKICGQKIEAIYKKNYEWNFPNAKIEYMDNSPDKVSFIFSQDNQEVFHASTTLKTLQQNRRFITHDFSLYDLNDNKIGNLTVDLRFITKQQLLDLMYSPTKLSATKLSNKSEVSNSSLLSSKVRSNSSSLATAKKHELKNIAEQPQISGRSSNRYKKVHINNSYNEIIFSRAKRFDEKKPLNPNASYSDPAKLSDFTPMNSARRGAAISLSRKVDFTKQYKNNPGVGEYKLPSIWDKY